MSSLLEKTSLCVKCGLCLAECPTFAHFGSEAYSPRGRIALARHLVSGQLAADFSAYRRLSTCLGCRRCEKLCPSGVEYGKILDESMLLLQEHVPAAQRWIAAGLSSGLATKLKGAFGSPIRTGWHEPRAEATASVALFVGCTGLLFEADLIGAIIKLLVGTGIRVWIPKSSHCCGALLTRQGQSVQGIAQLNKARALFNGQEVQAILAINPACAIHLFEHNTFSAPVYAVEQYLVQSKCLDRLQFHPLPTRVALHTPCLCENVLNVTNTISSLLEKIPELSIIRAGKPGRCCGAAGLQFLNQPELANALRAEVVSDVATAHADILLTSSLGCARHLAKGLTGGKVRVLNPLRLLAQQMIDDRQ